MYLIKIVNPIILPQISVEAAASRSGSGRNAYWMLIFCGVISYSLYLMECSYAIDRIELCDRKTQHTSRVCEQIERMKSALPVIWLVVWYIIIVVHHLVGEAIRKTILELTTQNCEKKRVNEKIP